MLKNLLTKRKTNKKLENNCIMILLVDDAINDFCIEEVPNNCIEMNFSQLKNLLENNSYYLKKYKNKNIAIYLAFKEKNK
jgi:hypothetical protein